MAPEEQNFASAAAGIVALALEAEERRRAEEQLHALAAHLETVREDERAGLARELHDELGQLLTALRMDVAWFGRAAREHPEKVIARGPERSAAMKELIDEAITTVQRISSDLRPGALHELGLSRHWSGRRASLRNGAASSAPSPRPRHEISPSDRQAVGLYRMMQEALTNVARHAGASRVQCELAVTRTATFSRSRTMGAASARKPGPMRPHSGSSECASELSPSAAASPSAAKLERAPLLLSPSRSMPPKAEAKRSPSSTCSSSTTTRRSGEVCRRCWKTRWRA
jgi:hypothetical protein